MISPALQALFDHLAENPPKRPRQCRRCNGTGREPAGDCPACAGTGKISSRRVHSRDPRRDANGRVIRR